MAITTKPMPIPDKIHVDLKGPEGNAFSLIGLAQRLAKQLHYQPDERGKLTAEMMSGDYKNLVMTFDNYFKGSVILETTNEELLP